MSLFLSILWQKLENYVVAHVNSKFKMVKDKLCMLTLHIIFIYILFEESHQTVETAVLGSNPVSLTNKNPEVVISKKNSKPKKPSSNL